MEEYYNSIQMGLPAFYDSGRNNPPHPEIWINYFLRMVLLYSNKVKELTESSGVETLENALSHLNEKQKDLLLLLLNSYRGEFTPKEVSLELGASNRTVINRLAALVNAGFVTPDLSKERIRSYKLSDFAKDNEKEIKKRIE